VSGKKTFEEDGENRTITTNMGLWVEFEGNPPFDEGDDISFKVVGQKKSGKKEWLVDPTFPSQYHGKFTGWGIDEGLASMLTGMVEALKPNTVLETGTNKGRSTRAIAQGLVSNNKGLMFTVDMFDHDIYKSGALTKEQAERVVFIEGETLEMFKCLPFQDLDDIDFAFLDGDHTAVGVEAELEYIDNHRAKECTVVIDNTQDSGWQDLQEFLKYYHKYPIVNLPTMTGTVIIQMKD
jgi:hypothetical protein|tara:strand:+ start:536 stop:1246 length:711 start_codon:yes stop_codon:yes gene_type:complete